ncbi:SRPBCC family protein [Methylocaldum sp. RMAD-M]|uniref:SRPBCC family protein n=1 Tax=Methylocaldum sp. RMAD-M TaxID=2806557 RepID=UPI000A32919A|nr:SRPBCC family protein [Methylocaldum sp. RMAD-M]MBP1151963.1 carbon monoxide dehydrogenase subunit G [Methylocaldum sp. RMAD-M]
MKKLLSLVAVLSLLWAGFANAHGPSRQKVTETVDINATPDAVWALVGDWANPQKWLPPVESTTAQGGTEKGATRELKLKSGGVIKEELKSYDASKMTMQYKITEVDPKDLPVANYSSNIKVEPNPAGGSKVEWNGAFYRSFMNNNPPPGQSDEAALKAVTELYKEGLANLKAVAEKK